MNSRRPGRPRPAQPPLRPHSSYKAGDGIAGPLPPNGPLGNGPLTRRLRYEPLEDRRLLALVTVDTVLDLVDFNDGKTSLREAIFATNTVPGADEIRFDPALFANGPATILLNHGELEITDALAIIGSGRDKLTIDAQQHSRIFNITATTGDFSISGVTITGGRTVDDNASNDTSQSGGGIRSRTTGAFVLDAVTIVSNETYGAEADGGGVYATTLTIRNSAVTGNAAKNAGGGGLHALTLVMERCVISGNKTVPESEVGFRSEGGGISAQTATISDSEISQNTARGLGGGIFSGRLTLSRSTVRDNYSFFGGGGIRALNDATIRDSIISGNTADYGGGIRFSGRLTIERSSVLNNVAENREGGGIYGDNVLNVINCIIAGNSTTQSTAPGGGIYSRGAVTIRDSDISNNRTAGAKSPGGGIFGRDVVIRNSVIAGNETLGEFSPGGGIYATGRATLDRVTVRNNRTIGDDSPGAGIASGSGSSSATFVTDSVMTFNETAGARSHGGGIFSRVLAITDVLIAKNHAAGSASNGGGVAATSVTATNATLSSNSAAGSGGGVFITSLGNVNTFNFTTIADNQANVGGTGGGIGGGLFVTGGSAEFNNSLVTRNADAGGTSNVAGDFTINFSMVGGGEEFLGPLADNGGATLTHALFPGSPAINAGDPNFLPGVQGAPEFDQRGAPFTRLTGARVDMGAFEFQSPAGALDADFDFSGHADGLDFLAWQRHFGKPSAATYRQGDATADGDVDSSDLAVWKARFGAEAASEPPATSFLPLLSLRWGVEQLSTGDPKSPERRAVVGSDFPLLETEPPIDAAPLEAATIPIILVTTLDDIIDLADGKLSLREAIFATNTVPGADEIRFDPALFANGSSTILLTQGELKITDSLTLTGPGAELLAIDASGNDPTPDQNNGDGSRVFNIAGRRTIAQVSITGTTLTGGDVSTDGGAVTATSSSLRLDMVHVVANGAQFYGAITWYGALGLDSTLRVSNSQIVENWSAVGASAIMAIGSLAIERSVISHNASQALYPAILAGNYIGETHVSISESQITENVGGGVASYGRQTFVTACTISDNNARYGGGLWMSEGTLLALSSSTVSHNTATISGGGIYLSGLAQSLIVDSTLSGNSAIKNGGGIFADNATLEIQRSTVADNHADGDADARNVGGGIRFDSRGTRLTLVHVVIAGNVVGTSTASDVSTRSNSFTARHSLIGSNAGTPRAEAPVGAPDANGNLIGGPIHGPIDPLLAPLADNGGPTLPGGARLLTHALLPGSPALNAGDPAAIAGFGDTPEFDQRGAPYSRVVGRIDIGAVEQIPPLLVVDTLADESDGDYHPGDLSLREAIELANFQPGPNEIRFDPTLFAAGSATILLTHGELKITDSLTLTGPGADLLTIDASGNDPTPDVDNIDGSRILNVISFSGGQPVVVVGLAMTGGDTAIGSAIQSASSLFLVGVKVWKNSGEAIRANSRLEISDSEIVENVSSAGPPAIFALNSLTLRRTLVADNVSMTTGAAVYASDGLQAVRIEDSTIVRNKGGGVLSLGLRDVRISRSLIAQNSGRVVGGLYVSGGRFAIDHSTVAENSTLQVGGGIYLNGTLSALIESSTISSNTAGLSGGGVSANEKLTVRYSTITNNAAYFNGSAMSGGGGILAPGRSDQLTLDHVIVAGNLSAMAANDVGGGGPKPIGARFSILGTNAGIAMAEAPLGTPDANGNYVGGPIHGAIDPVLGPLADHGGPTLTHALLPGSPAFDAGDLALAPGIGGIPEFDQRGAPFTRLAGSRIDIGAFETQSPAGALNADFDFSGHADGLDFLAWQRHFGKPSAATYRQGDATADGDVDSSDLAVWKARFGAEAASETPHASLPPLSSPERGGIGGGVIEVPTDAAPLTLEAAPIPIILVTTLDDTINLADGKLSLREAIFATNTVPGTDEIRFDPALFAGGPASILLKQGELKITDSLTIAGPGADFLTIDASGNDPTPGQIKRDGSRAFNIDNGDNSTVLEIKLVGMTVTGGDSSSPGGAIRTVESLQLHKLMLVNNAAEAGGGAVAALIGGQGYFELDSSFVANNRGAGNGGAIQVVLSENASATFSDNVFQDNVTRVTFADGGGLYLKNSGAGNITIFGNQFSGNSTQAPGGSGGGIYLSKFGAGDVELLRNTFDANHTQGNSADGGGAFISFSNGGSLVVSHNEFAGNYTSGTTASGGGVYISRSGTGTFEVYSNSFFGNHTNGTSGDGGGAFIGLSGAVQLDLKQNDFTANSASRGSAYGGGLFLRTSDGAAATVLENDVKENSSLGNGANGGGLAIFSSRGGSVLVTGNHITHNSAQGTFAVGNGIFVSASSGGLVEVQSNHFEGNAPLDDSGLAFAAIGGATTDLGMIRIERNTVTNNYGGISISGSGAMEANENVISANTALGLVLSARGPGVAKSRGNVIVGNSGGMSIGAQQAGRVTIEDTLIAGNAASKEAGAGVAAFIRSGGSIDISGVTVSDNHLLPNLFQTLGGGIRVDNRGGDFKLENSTISGNSSAGDGGGLWLGGKNEGDFESRFIVRHNTIVHNVADADQDGEGLGGGIVFASGNLLLEHSVVALNDGNFLDLSVSATEHLTLRHNLVGNNSGSSLAEAPLGAPDANGNLIGGPLHGPIDPLLAPLADNGGPTLPGGARLLTHALLPGSPALDAGDPNFLPGVQGAPEFDQRDAPFTRLAGARVDMGAFEFQSPAGALDADFDFSGHADGLDFLAWQRHFGKPSAATYRQGDATADGDVDSSDLAVWKARFGAEAVAAAALTADPLPPPTTIEAGVTAPTNAVMRRQSQFSPPARSIFEASRRQEFAPTPRDVALAAANEDLADDEIESSELHDSDLNIEIWDEALSRY